MAIRNVQPFHKGAGGPDSPDTNWPLRPSPYHSRVEDQEIDFEGRITDDKPTNYQFVAFRPGFSLQASELNEMQEHAQMQLTLTINMYHNWITSGRGSMWSQFEANSIGGQGGIVAGGFNTSIGQGGGWSSGGDVSHDENYAVSAPGWKGACPLHPYASPYQGTQIADGRPVTVQMRTGNRLRITFWPGWWLTEVRRPWNGQLDSSPADVSGLKHWVYLDIGTEVEADPIYYTDIYLDNLGGREAVAGLVTNSNYYECCPDDAGTPETPCDPTLADNATGVPNSAACGATRYGVYFSRAIHAYPENNGNWSNTDDPTDTDAFNLREGMAPVCKIDPVQRTVRYMNNILLAEF